ncbi:MAG: DUF58 domain-containing protein [Oceanicoccus sp.]
MVSATRKLINRRFKRWLDRRIPPTRKITLDQKRLFIFPSRPGRWFVVLLFVMFLAAINYQNNMSFALVFLLVSFFIVAILHTFANLSGLTVSAGKSNPVFAGEMAEFELSLSRHGKKDYFDINVSWPTSEHRSVTLTTTDYQQINLHLPVAERGFFRPDRLLIESFYPIGLLRCWTLLALDIEVLVYPKPLPCDLAASAGTDTVEEGEVVPVVGSDDFYEFKQYQPGDSPKHVFWKSYAKGQDLVTKQFASYREQRVWLEWDRVDGSTEDRLSKLCFWVLKLDNSHDEYGLRLPGVEIAPGHGEQHRAHVLKALAIFDLPGTGS